jgi:uncharacterized RDD family membrane protein YckC
VDLALVSMILFFGATVGAIVSPGGYVQAVLGVFTFVVVTGYWITFEYRWQGRTPGKRMFGLRVVGERGLRLDLGQIVLRNLLRMVDLMPGFGGIGASFLVLHREHRRLGDLVAGTLVVRERRVPAPERLRSVLGGVRVKQRLLPMDARRRLTPAEREFLLDLCLRRDALDDRVRMDLFRTVAADLRARLEPDEGDTEGLSDEKLVLIVTAELYERGPR